MSIYQIRDQFAYDAWANHKLFDVLRTLTPEQFTQPIAGSYGSIRNTLVHTMSAHWGWLDRCGGAKRGPALLPDDFPTVDSVVERWIQIERDTIALLDTLNDDDLDRRAVFALGNGPTHSMRVGDMLRHAANHSAHHRGQVALMIRMLGTAPGNFDMLIYHIERERGTASVA